LKIFPESSETPFLPYHAVSLIKGGHTYFELLENMIHEAQHTLHLQVYIFDEDETGRQVGRALIKAALRGVQVFVLVDGYASQNLSTDFVHDLRDAGIYFRRFEPLMRSKHLYFGRRLHHKVVVADAERCLVGGLNISDRYNDTSLDSAWLDWALYAEGIVAGILDTLCNRRTRNRKFMKTVGGEPTEHPLNLRKGTCAVRVRVNDWVHRKRQISNSYLQMFEGATARLILMSPYFMPGNEFRKKMRLAVERGVKIKVILAGVSDISLSKYAERFVYQWLFKNRIEIYEYQKKVLHGKIAVCDGEWMTAGSYNMNDLSAYASIELNLDVKNTAFAHHAEARLLEIIDLDCVQITEDAYQHHTSWSQRILQRCAFDITRLLLFLFTFYWRQRD
jgi:cardiolipin synthase